MFGFHAPELIIILVVALLIFGPKRLPEMGSSIGKSIKEFRKGMSELTSPKEEKEADRLPDTDKLADVEAIQREIASKKARYEKSAVTEEPEVTGQTTSSEVGSKEIHVE